MKFCALICSSFIALNIAEASQIGPEFPTHRFPTDESFHFSFQAGKLNSDSNFIDQFTTDAITGNGSVDVFRQQMVIEFQPNRRFSVGGFLNYHSLSLRKSGASYSTEGLADQWFFSEYRFYDVVGASMGLAFLAKTPGYKNPVIKQLQGPPAKDGAALLGDAQSDFGPLLTLELWPTKLFRTRVDFGYLYRTEQYSGEFPLLFSFGFVTPKIDLDLKIRGNLSQGNDAYVGGADSLAHYFPSRYAQAKNPWLISLNPTAELWLTTSWATLVEYTYSWMGNQSPHFHYFSAGLRYRWAQSHKRNKKTFQEKDISYDQTQGVFEGEQQTEPLQKTRPREIDPIADPEIDSGEN